MRSIQHLIPLLLLLAPFTCGSLVWAKEAPPDAPKVWNESDKARDVKAWIKEYVTADAARRTEIGQALDDLGVLKLASVKRRAKSLLKTVRKLGPKLTKKARQSFEHDGLTGPIQVTGAKKRKPLFIALHGGGQGAGDGKSAMQKWGMVSGKCILIGPTTPKKVGGAWNQPEIERWVLALIDAAKRAWEVDTNRIYVAGHSMGGYGTWSIGTRHADRFAALSACAGGLYVMGTTPAPGHIPNLLNTPIWFYNSTDDKQVSFRSSHAADEMLEALKKDGYPYVWKYDEYNDIGHGVPPKGLKPIVDWMLEHEREPNPKWLVWEPSREHKRRFAWLGRPVGNGRVEGKIDKNTITLTGRGRTTVYLNPSMVDMKKPVTIRRDDKTLFEGLVHPRLSVLLQTIVDDEDPKRWYCCAIAVE